MPHQSNPCYSSVCFPRVVRLHGVCFKVIEHFNLELHLLELVKHLPTDTEESRSITTQTMDYGVPAHAVFIPLTTIYLPSTSGTVNALINLVVSPLATHG